MATITHTRAACLGPVGTTGLPMTGQPRPPAWEVACSGCGLVTSGPRTGQYVSKDDPAITSNGICETCSASTWERFRRANPRNHRGELIADWRGESIWHDMMDGLTAEARSATLRSARNQRRGGRAQG